MPSSTSIQSGPDTQTPQQEQLLPQQRWNPAPLIDRNAIPFSSESAGKRYHARHRMEPSSSSSSAESVDAKNECSNGWRLISSTLDTSTKLTKQVILPIVSDILLFLGSFNKDGAGRVLDVDVKSRFERYRIQVIKASEGNPLAK